MSSQTHRTETRNILEDASPSMSSFKTELFLENKKICSMFSVRKQQNGDCTKNVKL
jgi:hypothetical protein